MSNQISNGEVVQLAIQRVGIYGEGVGLYQGLTIFVDGALPGEIVYARISDKRKTYARADLVSISTQSPHRVQPICPLFGTCGGCQIMHLAYEEQLIVKRQMVIDALERIGKFNARCVADCVPSPQPLAYRNKIQLPAGNGFLGLYARDSHHLIPIEHCFIHCQLGEAIFQAVRHELQPQITSGQIKCIVIKTATGTNQALVIVISKQQLLAQQIAKKLIDLKPQICGVIGSIDGSEKNSMLSGPFHTIAGDSAIFDSIAGFQIKVSPASFFQVNPLQAEQLYQYVLQLCDLNQNKHVLDAYCGVGVLSLLLAKKAGHVIGIESVAVAVADAQENSRINGVHNVDFICGKAENLISSITNIDVAILNPPRKGCDSSMLHALAQIAPKRIIYISCDPATLARDLHILSKYKYQLINVTPFDMFPQTAHVETVALLEKII